MIFLSCFGKKKNEMHACAVQKGIAVPNLALHNNDDNNDPLISNQY